MHFKKWFGLVFVAVLLAGCAQTQAAAETSGTATAGPRVALVIGNARYSGDGMPPLGNPVNDAKLMTKSLRQAGFDVIQVDDADQKNMVRAISAFGDQIAAAGPKATGLFYFAGYGISVYGTSYLIPIGAEIAREADVDLEAIPLSSVMEQMTFALPAVSIVIVDASRNNGLSRSMRSAGRGLSIQDMDAGMYLGYAAAPGTVALDGTWSNSPYTTALAKAMLKPGADINSVFTTVRQEVLSSTGHKQLTWDASTLTQPFVFIPEN